MRQKAALPTLARRGRQPHTFSRSAWPLPPQVSVPSVCTWGSLNPCSVWGLIPGAQVGGRPGVAEESCAMRLLPGRRVPCGGSHHQTNTKCTESALGRSPSTAHLEGLLVVGKTTDRSLVTPPASPGTERLTQPSGQTRPSKPRFTGEAGRAGWRAKQGPTASKQGSRASNPGLWADQRTPRELKTAVPTNACAGIRTAAPVTTGRKWNTMPSTWRGDTRRVYPHRRVYLHNRSSDSDRNGSQNIVLECKKPVTKDRSSTVGLHSYGMSRSSNKSRADRPLWCQSREEGAGEASLMGMGLLSGVTELLSWDFGTHLGIC